MKRLNIVIMITVIVVAITSCGSKAKEGYHLVDDSGNEFTPYLGPNGFPYRYDVENHTLMQTHGDTENLVFGESY